MCHRSASDVPGSSNALGFARCTGLSTVERRTNSPPASASITIPANRSVYRGRGCNRFSIGLTSIQLLEITALELKLYLFSNPALPVI